MDFDVEVKEIEYTPEQEEFAKEVRIWLDENVPKDIYHPRDPTKATYEQWLQRRELGIKAGKKGWLYPTSPKEQGGGGLNADQAQVITEECAKRDVSFRGYFDVAGLAMAAINVLGTDEQKQKHMPPMISGEAITWQLFTEPEAGTDAANQQTNALRATREDDHFIINGQKIFVGGLYPPPDLLLLLTRSDLKAERHENLSMFLAPANLEGITIQALDLFTPGRISEVFGQRADGAAGQKYTVFFDDVKVHESYLIGKEGDGWAATNATLSAEQGGGRPAGGRPGAGGGPVAPPRPRNIRIGRNVMVQKFLEQCKTNPNIIKRLKENPLLVERVVNVYIGAEIERLNGIRNMGGRGGMYGGPQAQLHTTNFGTRFIADMAAVMGPYALVDDEEWGLENGIFDMAERCGICLAPAGTPEALKIVISRALSIGR